MDFENPNHLLAAGAKIRAKILEMQGSASLSFQQAATSRDEPVTGNVWVSKFAVPKAPNGEQDNSRDLLLSLVDDANEKNIPYDRADSGILNCEWTGFRRDAKQDTPEPPSMSEGEKFQKLEAETRSPLTVLYIYGGTFALNCPSSYRRTVGSLAQATGSKVLMVRQRLAPQNPFPAALLDVFQAYLTLLAPPPGSPHQAISPSSIVVTGDSSGATLAMGLLQILLRLKKRNASIIFHGQHVQPSVPAGMALLCPVVDLTSAFPSFEKNKHYDIFPVPIENLPYLEKNFPPCAAWPTNPPRANIYCEPGMLAHPIVSPAASDDWTGACPIWIAAGHDQSADATRFIAQTLHKQGVPVTLHEYENMPHVFFMYFRKAPQTRKLLKGWAATIVSFGQGKYPSSSASFFRAKGLAAEQMDIDRLSAYTVSEVKEILWKKTFGYKIPSHQQRTLASL